MGDQSRIICHNDDILTDKSRLQPALDLCWEKYGRLKDDAFDLYKISRAALPSYDESNTAKFMDKKDLEEWIETNFLSSNLSL